MVLMMSSGDLLTSILNIVSQSLLIPTIIILLIFVVYAVITLGGLIYEYKSRKNIPTKIIKDLIYRIYLGNSEEEVVKIINNSPLLETQKYDLIELASSNELALELRESLARQIIDDEENKMDKILEKTDIVARIGPTLGLMGTLIPMGPGLAALGNGDVNTLAQAIIVAFDTTVVGIASGAVGYFVSKIRKRWYDKDISNLETLADAVLEFLKNPKERKTYLGL